MVSGILAPWKERRAARRAKARSDKIDSQIEEEAKTFKRTYDILLMGINHPETCALVRQLKICEQGYSREELIDFRLSIWRYLLETSRRIVQDLQNLGLEPANYANKANCERILNHPTDTDHPNFHFQHGFAEAVQELWADDVLAVLFDSPAYISLTDDAAYIFLGAHRITSKEYIPSNDDVLRAPVPVFTETFLPLGEQSLRLLHVTQRSDWKKWIDSFESVTSIIFCASLADYDRWEEREQTQRNLLSKSIDLFRTVVNSRWFLRASIVLFLTEITALADKLPRDPLENYLPSYTGGADVLEACQYILQEFLHSNHARLTVYAHFTDVSDTSCVRFFSAAVQDTILQNRLKDCGLL